MSDQNTKLVPFTISKPQYDENTYVGRFLGFRKTCNVLHAFYPNKKIRAFQEQLKKQREIEEANEKEFGTKEIMMSEKDI